LPCFAGSKKFRRRQFKNNQILSLAVYKSLAKKNFCSKLAKTTSPNHQNSKETYIFALKNLASFACNKKEI